jgi:hypothetical protein
MKGGFNNNLIAAAIFSHRVLSVFVCHYQSLPLKSNIYPHYWEPALGVDSHKGLY